MDADLGPDDQLIAVLAGRLTRWGLRVPAVAFLELNKPFSFIGSQFLLLVQPIVEMFAGPEVTGNYVALLEDRDNVERLIQELERGEEMIVTGD